MNVHQLGIRRRRFGRRAFSALSAILAAVFLRRATAFCSCRGSRKVLQTMVTVPASDSFSGRRTSRRHLSYSPRALSKEGTLGLGLFFVGFAVYWYSADQEYRAGTLAILGLVLLLFGACLRLRRRADASLWNEMLGRYADLDTGRADVFDP